MSMTGAVLAAFGLIKRHWLLLMEMAVFVFVVAMLANIAIVAAIVLMLSPYLSAAAIAGGDSATLVQSDAVTIGVVLYLVMMGVFSAVLTTWQWVSWAQLFMLLQDKKTAAKLSPVLSRFR